MPSCTQPACRVADTGVCLEGHKGPCPHKTEDGSLAETTDIPALESDTVAEDFEFYTGDKLTVSEASEVLSKNGGRVILTAGGRSSGKTTFIARIGELFRSGTFSEFCFAESLTLCAFERATWKATVPSGAGAPDTDRTGRIENDMFFHLRVVEQCRYVDLLISDLAGETFPTIVGSAEVASRLQALARADYLVLFLDCARLVDLGQRQPEWDNAGMFLRRIHPKDSPNQIVHLQVIFSRWDYVLSNENSVFQIAFCERVEQDLRVRFAGHFSTIEFFRVAARPDFGAPTNGEIQKVFKSWCKLPLDVSAVRVDRNPSPARDFSAFGL